MKYFELIADIDGEAEVIFGSFVRNDVVEEKDAEKDSLKRQGYKKLRVVSREVEETPDADVYDDNLVTKQDLFMQQAPSFNFEYDADDLLELALDRGFVSKVDGQQDLYIINDHYQSTFQD